MSGGCAIATYQWLVLIVTVTSLALCSDLRTPPYFKAGPCVRTVTKPGSGTDVPIWEGEGTVVPWAL